MDHNSNTFLEVYKAKALETFSELIDFLNANNLTWWVAYGTAIGTVRHKGFIPWDDDIDIWMPRTDYEKFLQLSSELPSSLKTIDFTKQGYNYSFAKVYNTNTTYWEAPQYPFAIGLWIDIFPLDSAPQKEIPDRIIKYHNEFKRGVAGGLNFSAGIALHYIKHRQYKSLVMAVLNTIIYGFGRHKRMQKFLDFHAYYISQQVGDCYYDLTVKNSCFPKHLFRDTIKMPFENLIVNLPSGYDELLRSYYGDYMQLPPESHRTPFHVFSYINMKEGLSMEDVKLRISNGETCVL